MKQIFFLLLTVLLVNSSSFGQAKLGAFGELIIENSAPMPQLFGISNINSNTQNGVKHNAEANKVPAKKITKVIETVSYMSFKVEIMTVEMPLDLDHHIFSSYDGITFNQTKSNGYTYFSGDFSDQEQASVMLEKVQRVYPRAEIVKERKYLQQE
jgi:hypothetical protein